MVATGSDTVDGVHCDKFEGRGGYNCTAWFKSGTNILVQTVSSDDERGGCDKGLKVYTEWQATINTSYFDIKPAWHCQKCADIEAPAVRMN